MIEGVTSIGGFIIGFLSYPIVKFIVVAVFDKATNVLTGHLDE